MSREDDAAGFRDGGGDVLLMPVVRAEDGDNRDDAKRAQATCLCLR